MEDGNKLVIGGGISGLIWCLFNPEYKIITPEVGGNYGKTHMVWLHDTPETRLFLKKAGFTGVAKKSYIGYYDKGWIYNDQNPELNLRLIQKKMTEWNQPLNIEFKPDSTKLSLGDELSVNYMNTLDVDLVEVVKKLDSWARIERGFVTKITPTEVHMKDSFTDEKVKIRPYKKLVSTIAAPFFWKGYGKEKEFKSLPITNIVTSVRPAQFDDRYEMIYYDETVPFSRMSHLGGKYAIEFSGIISEEEFKALYPNLPLEEYFVVKQGRIFSNGHNIEPQDNILFLGRFAEWQHGITTEHVVKRTIEKTGRF